MITGKVKFSILTPTWNRVDYLERVFHGLTHQSFQNFEWIVADDGSIDDTRSVVRAFAEKSDFPVTLICANHHIGKIRMDNEAVRLANGELILWCDSDDYLNPNALQRLWETWNSIPSDRRAMFVGVTALAATEKGCITNPFPNITFKDVSWNDLAEIQYITEDMLFCARADALKSHPFPEVDMVIPESVVWSAIGHSPTRLIPEVLKRVEYQAPHAISFSGTMSYNRGRAYALAATVSNLRHYRRTWKIRIWRLITFIRYCLHGEIKFRQAIELWGNNSTFVAFIFAYPIAWVLALKDRIQGKVRKTHREFLSAQANADITVEVLNKP